MSQQQIMDIAATNPTMTMAELLAQQRGEAAGASPFRSANGPPVLLLANVATTNAPASVPPPATTAALATVPLLAATAAQPVPAEPAPDINAFTEDNKEMTQFYAADKSAHTPIKQGDTSVARASNQSPNASSERAEVLANLFRGFNWLVEDPTRLFRIQYKYREEHKRIQRALMPDVVNASAEATTEQVHGKRSLPPRNMRGLVREEANKINDATAREIASLRSQLEKIKADLSDEPPAFKRAHAHENKNKNKNKNKSSNANGNKNKGSKKKGGGGGRPNKGFCRSRGRAAGKGTATQPRGRAVGSGKVSSNDKGKSNKNRSRSKSAGRKRASGTERRN